MDRTLRECEKVFEKLVSAIGFKAPDSIFEDLVDLTLYFLSGGKCMANQVALLEKEYTPNKIKIFDNVFIKLVELSHDFVDAFGTLYEIITYQGKSQLLGQYFTPQPLSKMLADSMMRNILQNGLSDLYIGDITGCGSGRNLLAAAEIVEDNRWRYFFVGVDIDPICAKLTAINCFLQCMPSWIYQGNSLTFECKTCYQVSVLPGANGRWIPVFEELSAQDTQLAVLALAGKNPKTGAPSNIPDIKSLNRRRIAMLERVRQEQIKADEQKKTSFIDAFNQLEKAAISQNVLQPEQPNETPTITDKISVVLSPNLQHIAKKIKNNRKTPPDQQTLF